ncbi:MAG: hypothetical protein LV480_04510 [Methylacidiphilales bacterium]|nr:hypothetical protein [Candidatus Methylacidiphilales bacterium]
MSFSLKLATWAALCVLLSGFVGAQPSSAPEAFLASNDDGMDAGSSFDKLNFVDPDLDQEVDVLRVGSEVGANNLLSVFAGFKNKTEHTLKLEVKTVYQDKEGNALNPGSWISITLKPDEEKEYHSTAISELAVDFVIRVRHRTSASADHH